MASRSIVAQTMAARMFTADNLPVPCAANCREIAAASSFNPRVMRQILSNLRDISLVKVKPTGTDYDLSLALTWLGLSGDGLTDMCRHYLVVLLSDFGGDGAGAAAMQDRLQEPGGLAYTETLLMQKGLIGKSNSGRVLTAQGIRRARQIVTDTQQAA